MLLSDTVQFFPTPGTGSLYYFTKNSLLQTRAASCGVRWVFVPPIIVVPRGSCHLIFLTTALRSAQPCLECLKVASCNSKKTKLRPSSLLFEPTIGRHLKGNQRWLERTDSSRRQHWGVFLYSAGTVPNPKISFPVTTLKTTRQIKIECWVSSKVVNWNLGWQRRLSQSWSADSPPSPHLDNIQSERILLVQSQPLWQGLAQRWSECGTLSPQYTYLWALSRSTPPPTPLPWSSTASGTASGRGARCTPPPARVLLSIGITRGAPYTMQHRGPLPLSRARHNRSV